MRRLLVACWLVACGSEAPAAPAPSIEVDEPVHSADPVPASEEPAIEAPRAGPASTPTEDADREVLEVRAGFAAMLPQLEAVPASPEPSSCAMRCALENDARLVVVTPLAIEGDGSPTSLEVRVAGRDPLVRTVRVDGSEEAWMAYQDGEGPAPWLGALTRAMPALPASRPARDLVTERAVVTFSLSGYAPLVALGEGRYLYWHTARYAHHLYLVHGSEHQMRRVASLPIEATACDGMGDTTACVRPVGIEGVYTVPGDPTLLVRLYHPEAGHGIDAFSTLLVPLEDDAALRPGEAAEALEVEASLVAPGARVRAFSADLREGEPCDAGCVYFREDRTFSWSFPEVLSEGSAESHSVRRRDGTLATPLLPRDSAAQAVHEELGEATLARDVIARAVTAAWNGFAYSPMVELGPPHMGRRLSIEGDVVSWHAGELRAEVARMPDAPSGTPSGMGPWGIDRVLAPEGAGYPLIVVAVAPLARTRAEPTVRHRVALLIIARGPSLEPAPED